MEDASRDSGRPGYAALEVLVGEQSALIEALRARVAEQDVVIEELKRKLNRDSRNSSRPPSPDPPKSRAERRREARAKLKELSKRKPGGQPGHEGKHREMAPRERVDHRSAHLPDACGCGHRCRAPRSFGMGGAACDIERRHG